MTLRAEMLPFGVQDKPDFRMWEVYDDAERVKCYTVHKNQGESYVLDLHKEQNPPTADAPRLAEENERLRDALRKLINAAELEEFTEERSDDPLSIAKAALSGREE